MNITSQTPQPQRPRGQRGNRWSWLFFLLILARPLWGIVRSLVGPQISNQQIALVIGGAVVAGVAVMFITRSASRITTREQSQSAPIPTARTYRPATGRNATWTPPQASSYQGQTPRFEPMITGKVVLVGIILAALIGGGIVLIAGTIS